MGFIYLLCTVKKIHKRKEDQWRPPQQQQEINTISMCFAVFLCLQYS